MRPLGQWQRDLLGRRIGFFCVRPVGCARVGGGRRPSCRGGGVPPHVCPVDSWLGDVLGQERL